MTWTHLEMWSEPVAHQITPMMYNSVHLIGFRNVTLRGGSLNVPYCSFYMRFILSRFILDICVVLLTIALKTNGMVFQR